MTHYKSNHLVKCWNILLRCHLLSAPKAQGDMVIGGGGGLEQQLYRCEVVKTVWSREYYSRGRCRKFEVEQLIRWNTKFPSADRMSLLITSQKGWDGEVSWISSILAAIIAVGGWERQMNKNPLNSSVMFLLSCVMGACGIEGNDPVVSLVKDSDASPVTSQVDWTCTVLVTQHENTSLEAFTS